MPSTIFLLFRAPSSEVLRAPPPAEWASQIRAAVQRLLDAPVAHGSSQTSSSSSDGASSRLVVLFALDASAERLKYNLAFSHLDAFLQWAYGQAWSVAVERDALLFNVDVLLVPGASKEVIGRVLERERGSSTQDQDGTEANGDLLLLAEQEVLDAFAPPSWKTESIPPTPKTAGSFMSIQVCLPQYPVVALGGTFDHLHAGHKILLSAASALTTRKLIIGITSDEMLRSKAEAGLLESIERRKERVERFVRAFSAAWREAEGQGAVEIDAVTLRDVAGPAGTETDLQALVLTQETLSGGAFIADVREKNGLGALDQHVISVLGAKGETGLGGQGGETDAKQLAAAKVGSTAIRKWLAAKEGPKA
ncbi:Elongator subunit elp2 [Tilletia horrida]|nr:Elongator subunit elp2 [Tilletia horrida]